MHETARIHSKVDKNMPSFQKRHGESKFLVRGVAIGRDGNDIMSEIIANALQGTSRECIDGQLCMKADNRLSSAP